MDQGEEGPEVEDEEDARFENAKKTKQQTA